MNLPQSSLKVFGQADEVDSFVACLSAAARHFGLRSDYTYISGLSGACFSPCHNRGETCIGWMMDGGSPARVEFIARVLGMRLERIDLDAGAPDGWQDEYIRSKNLPSQASQYFYRLFQTLAEGKLALLPTWPAWSLLTGWEDDLVRLPFATVRGFERVVRNTWPPLKTSYAWALSPGDFPPPEAKVAEEALAYAAGIATGKIIPGPAGFGDENIFGGELYAVILERLDHEMLCPGCNENGCFARVSRRLHDGHMASLAFLQEAVQHIPEQMSASLQAATAGYSDLAHLSLYWAELAKNPDIFDQPELRPRIRVDFTRMQGLHAETANLLSGFSSGVWNIQ